MMTTEHYRTIEACLETHPAVERAHVCEEGPIGAQTLVAILMPAAERAPEVRRACELEDTRALQGLSLHEPGIDLIVAQHNPRETDFLYREIFVDDMYLQHGIRIPPHATVVDIGANIGMFSVRAARAAPGVRVFAVEPVPEVGRAAQLNGHIHGVDLKLRNAVVSDRNGTTSFTYYPNNSVMSSRFGDLSVDRATVRAYLTSEGTVADSDVLEKLITERIAPVAMKCEMITLQSLMRQERIEQIDLLKLDVERAEMEVLRGMADEAWTTIQQVVAEVHDIDGTLREAIAILKRAGFVTQAAQDPRLVGTNCYNLYAYRAGYRATQSQGASGAPALLRSRKAIVDVVSQWAESRLPMHFRPHRMAVAVPLPQTRAALGNEGVLPPPTTRRATDAGPELVIQKKLLGIVRDVLGRPELSVEDDFFRAGGTSLRAVMLLVRVGQEFGPDVLPPDVLFRDGRVVKMAEAIEDTLAEGASS